MLPPVKVVIAPDKFKDCLAAAQVAEAIAAGVRDVDGKIEIDLCPMADGGEGTVAALVAATGGRIETHRVTGPLAAMKVEAPVGILGDGKTAVVEMASASGLQLLKPEQRDPTRTTTYGTGELLRAAHEHGAKRIILGIGGSATVDGGIGAAQAWGAKFSLISGQVYSVGDRKLTGGDLIRLRTAHGNAAVSALPALRTAGNGDGQRKPGGRKPPPELGVAPVRLKTHGVQFVVACDVGNPLLGPDGAAAIFGPQKGATPEQVKQLEDGLNRLVEITQLHELAEAPGAGAAGGLGFGMLAFFGASLVPGIDIVIDAVKLRERLQGAELCITGEGRFDAQSLAGKTAVGVARVCKELGVPCVALAGAIGPGAEAATGQGVTAYFSICPHPMRLEDSIRQAPALLRAAAKNVINLRRR